MNQKLPDVQAGFRKGRGARDQITSIHWIIEKQGNSRKTSTASLTTGKFVVCSSQQTVQNSATDVNTGPPYLPPVRPIFRSRSNS